MPSFDEYVASLDRLTPHVSPIAETSESRAVKEAASSLGSLPDTSASTISDWVRKNPKWFPVLGLVVGLSQEKLKNLLRHEFRSTGWQTLARQRADDLVEWLDRDFDLFGSLREQLARRYDFGDILVARAGSRGTATRAGRSGRRIEDEIENIARDLALPYRTRTRFQGRAGESAPCDLAVLKDDEVLIAVAAKGFDSTGSKLTDAVREIEQLVSVRLPKQYVFAVIDGIGWKSRVSDLQRIYDLWRRDELNGLYTLADLPRFRSDLEDAARRVGILG